MEEDLTTKAVDAKLADKSTEEEALLDEFDDDPVVQNYREKRMQELKKQMQHLEDLKQKAHGVYSELQEEKEFLNITTKEKKVVAHFCKTDFFRCKVMDKHLALLAGKHFQTKFIKVEVEKVPFFVEKLQVRVLPCVICFIGGVVVDRVVGFEDLGNKDDFPTELLEKRLAKSNVIQSKREEVKKVQKKKKINLWNNRGV